MQIKIKNSVSGFDANGREFTYYQGRTVDASDFIANDLLKHGHAELTDEVKELAKNRPIATAPEVIP